MSRRTQRRWIAVSRLKPSSSGAPDDPSFSLRLRQIDAVLAKFGRALGEAAAPLRSFLRRCRRVHYLFDSLCCELLSAQSPAGLADGPGCRLDLEAELDQAADGFGKRWRVGLLFSPPNDGSPNHGVCPEAHQRSNAGARAAHDFLFNRGCFLHTFCITQ